jgi:predicted DNA-binding ribbon-helix-helix protein
VDGAQKSRSEHRNAAALFLCLAGNHKESHSFDSESVYEEMGGYGCPNEIASCQTFIIIGGHKTSVSLEDAFWTDLKEIAHSQGATLSKLIGQIDETRQQGNLSSAIRLHVLEHIRRHGRNDLVGAIRAD